MGWDSIHSFCHPLPSRQAVMDSTRDFNHTQRPFLAHLGHSSTSWPSGDTAVKPGFYKIILQCRDKEEETNYKNLEKHSCRKVAEISTKIYRVMWEPMTEALLLLSKEKHLS